MNNKLDSIFLTKQSGVVLIVALIMLLVMTFIGITLMSDSTLQERMAGNNRQLFTAKANAELALREAELYLEGLNINDTAGVDPKDIIATNFVGGSDGKYIEFSDKDIAQEQLTDDLSDPTSWTTSNSIAAKVVSTSGTTPRYTIEYIGRMAIGLDEAADIDVSIETKGSVSSKPFVFRITAIGYGRDDNISAVLQSTYSTSD